MTRTQIQLPDALYKRAKRLAAERELSLAELTRRGLEMFLDRFPTDATTAAEWHLPQVNGGLKVAPGKLRDLVADEEESRGLARK